MIIAEVGRGLGNGFFIYAAAKSLAEHHKTSLKIDSTFLETWPKIEKFGGDWEYTLGKFNISSPRATRKELRNFVLKPRFRLFDKIVRRYHLFEKNVFRFNGEDTTKKFFALPDNIYLRGYFGEERFFKSIKKLIRKEFSLKEKYKKKINPLLDQISKENSVSIHVRRGDLIRLGALTMSNKYYLESVNIIKKNIKNPKFYVFSDEIDWCKKNLKLGVDLNFVEGHESYEDFEIMKNCKHNILANSALSWWVGYLNQNKQKIVISPFPFGFWLPKEGEPIKDNVPKDWVRVNILNKNNFNSN